MGHWLAPPGAAKAFGHLKRFDPRYWSVNFPRPMMASVVTTGAHSLKAECVFYRQDDLAGLIWEAEDRFDHVLLRYETARDFRACRLSFWWRSAGLRPLDAIDGPTLTIEGRDQAGQPRSWFVRLWNYASGTPEDAMIDLNFSSIDGGFLLPDEAEPVWAGDVDRMFISLVPPGFTRADAPFAAPEEGWVELSEIAELGLDCIGVAAMAMGVPKDRVRQDYSLHSSDPAEVDGELDESGFIRIAPAGAGVGDLLLVRTGPTGLHVVILTDGGYLHADMRLRRAVEVSGTVPWPILSAWRHPAVAAENPLAP